jgi:hypothetical protein
MNIQKKTEILQKAAEHREAEVLHHQINIDNYRLALEEIGANHAGDDDMLAFAEQLRQLLASSIREQTKEKILLKVIKQQLEKV